MNIIGASRASIMTIIPKIDFDGLSEFAWSKQFNL